MGRDWTTIIITAIPFIPVGAAFVFIAVMVLR